MKKPSIGPGFLVTAAFVGPGTVFTATVAGANFGFVLLWAVAFSVAATIILQNMTARLALATGQGLGENIVAALSHPILKVIAGGLVIAAIVIGNGAYEGGNVAGASLGLEGVFGAPDWPINPWPLFIGLIAGALLLKGNYKLLETALIALVAIMSLAFIVTAVLVQPDITDIFSGLFVPSLPVGATLTVIALIGTTVVPYNLFLHAASVSKKWRGLENLATANRDIYIAIPLGGLLTIAIITTAASAFLGSNVTINSAADIAPALTPLFGDWSTILIAVGLFCAGISSAITAPLAAAFALTEILNLNKALDSVAFKVISISILVIGVIPAAIGFKPTSIILFAQVANGVLLPLLALFLLFIMNQGQLGQARNTLVQNLLGAAVVGVTLLLSGRSLLSAFGLI